MSIPIARPFAFNSGPPIDGTIQVGKLAVGYPTYGFDSTGLQWWNGPDESLGYVIAQPVPDNSQPTPVYGLTASVGFYRTNGFNDSEFIFLANKLLGTTYTTASAASLDLTANGYWNSYVTPVLALDAGNTSSYPGFGTEWTDLVDGKVFNLINNPIYGVGFGGFLSFQPSSSQYAECSTSLPPLNTWSISVWHFYDGSNIGGSPCIVSEVFPTAINYMLGNGSDTSPNLQTGFFNGSWNLTPIGYILTPGWHFIVGTYDGINLSLYVDNSLIYSVIDVATPTSGDSGIVLMRRWDLNEYWGGLLAIVEIYDRALDSYQIDSLWNSNKSRFGL